MDTAERIAALHRASVNAQHLRTAALRLGDVEAVARYDDTLARLADEIAQLQQAMPT